MTIIELSKVKGIFAYIILKNLLVAKANKKKKKQKKPNKTKTKNKEKQRKTAIAKTRQS